MALDEEESVRIAVRALGDMRNGGHVSPSTSFQPTPALSVTSGSSSPSLPSPSLDGDYRALDPVIGSDRRADGRQSEDADFVSRMSKVPIVNSAIRVYEQSKASSRVVKYGARMMESSVKTISRPVIDRLPVNQLDEFACRQLDRIENYTRRTPSRDRDRVSRSPSSASSRSSESWDVRDLTAPRGPSHSREDERCSRWEDGPQASAARRADSRTPTPHSQLFSRPYSDGQSAWDNNTTSPQQSRRSSSTTQPENQQVAQRSRWQAMLLEAGGISAAVSDESMRRLRYVLQWLQYATAHIDAQILVLRNFIASLQPSDSSAAPGSPPIHISSQHLRTLHAAKRDVVETIRQVVDIVSRYAGGALPEPARASVRTFILRLPRRWAEAAGVDSHSSSATDGRHPGGADRVDSRRANASSAPYSYGPGEAGPSPRSRPPSRATSPGPSRAPSRRSSSNGVAGAVRHTAGNGSVAPTTAHAASQAAQRILTLATESLDMLRGVTAVVGESLDRADAWVERLRIIGLQRQQNGDVDGEAPVAPDGLPSMAMPPSASHSSHEHQRDFHTHRQSYVQSPSSPLSPYAPLSPLASATSSGRATPVYPLSRSNSSSALSVGHPGSLSSYYTANTFDTGGAAASLNALSLTTSSAAGSRYATPRSISIGLPPEGDGGGGTQLAGVGAFAAGSRGEKRSADGDDDTVVAATALAGLAGSAKRVKQDRGVDERMEVDS
ncbi:Opi1-domain-containing protein [Laetiporus sulphureus 93-53]|uniref:Opi1-domain-containing protein n=1 Tax=Laetiporus sulphureus 93-53 TaxID=1314785 RepID=A0A165EQ89_9APHY|nr:Opi1-domain-containing protein [Laetiporus sulphureus 93-53]KZT07538.1 Opi1-domain-containing protein [Laetiporus sulphureus 93-53]